MKNKKSDNLKTLITNDPSFVNSPKHNNDLYEVLKIYPLGVSEATIKRMLCLTPDEFAKIQNDAIIKLRKSFGEEDSDGKD